MTVTGLKKQIALTTQGGRPGRTGLSIVCHQAVSKVALGVTSDGGSVMDMVADESMKARQQRIDILCPRMARSAKI